MVFRVLHSRLGRIVWYTVLALVVVLAAYVALGRQFFPAIADFRPQLEAELTQQFNRPVAIGALLGLWDGLNPVVELQDISVGGESGLPLRLARLKVELSFWDSIRALGPKIKEFRFEGVQLQGRQAPDGTWQFDALPNQDATTASTPLPIDLLQQYLIQPTVRLSNSDITLTGRSGESYRWRIPDAQLSFEGALFSLTGKVYSPDNNESFGNLNVQGGYRPENGGVQAQLYLDWDTGGLLSDLLDGYQWQGVSVQNLATSGKLWITMAQSAVHQVRALVDVPELRLSRATKADQAPEIVPPQVLAPITDLRFDLLWSRGQDRSVLSLDGLTFKWQNEIWAPMQGMAYFKSDVTTVAMEHLNVGMLAEFAVQTGLGGEAGVEVLSALAPEGTLRNFWVTVPLSEDDTSGFRVTAELDHLAVQAYDGKPLARAIQGYLELSPNQGEVVLDAPGFVLGFPELFSQPWQTEHAQGRVTWEVDAQNIVHLRSYDLKLDFGQTEQGEPSYVTGDFYSLLPEGNTNNWLSLSISPHNIPADRTTEFVPVNRVPGALYEWLGKAIHSGRVAEGVYIGHGLVGDDDASEAFASAMHFGIQNGQVQFAPTWPALESITGRVTVTSTDLSVSAPSLSMGGIPYKEVSARQTYAAGKDNPLVVRFKTTLNGGTVDKVLREYPFSDQTLPIADAIRVQGVVPLWGRVDVPLSRPEQTAIDLSAKLSNTGLTVQGADIVFSSIRGDLRYTNWGGLNSTGLKVTLFDRVMDLGISSTKNDESLDTQIQLTGDVGINDLVDWAKIDLPKNAGIEGETRFLAALLVQQPLAEDQSTVSRLDLFSDLVGIEIALPKPFFKISPAILDFRFSKFIHGASEPDSFRIGNQVWGVISQESGGPAITLALNQPEFSHQTSPGVHVVGQFDELHLDAWANYLKRLETAPQQVAEPGAAGTPSPPPEEQTSFFRDASLAVGRLRYAGYEIKDTQFALKSGENDDWLLDFSGKELSGQIQVAASVLSPAENTPRAPIRIHLDHIYLADESKTQQEVVDTISTLPTTQDETGYVSIFSLPDVDLDIQQLNINGANWGAWQLESRLRQNEIVVEPLQWRVGDSIFQGRLNWKQEPTSGHQSSVLIGELALNQVLATAQQLGFEAPMIDAENGTVDLTLVWPRSPDKFGFEGLSGNLDLVLKNGQIVGTAGSADALKLFSVFNLDTLGRRLQLDFTDLYRGGISFDEIDATGHLQLGALTLKSPLVMQGPSNAFKVTGNTHLVKETLDMNLVVVFPLTENLPVAAAMVGAPAVGGALWAIDKLLEQIGDPLSKLTSANYHISGTWSQPEVALQSVFDRSPDNEEAPPVAGPR